MPNMITFFQAAYGSTEGYMCVASRRTGGTFTERFYKFPEELEVAKKFIKAKSAVENVYFCPQLLTERRRTKANVGRVQCVWADLDDCPPSVLLVQPTAVLETSPARYQAIWALSSPVDGEDAEAASRRVAYGHSYDGSDRSGWDLTQLLRVPGTSNWKYTDSEGAPSVSIVGWYPDNVYTLDAFEVYPQVEGYEYLDIPFPEFIYKTGEELLEENRHKINGAAFTIFHREPEKGARSTQLFRLEMYCLEARLSLSDAFQICRDAACNKFAEDQVRLWKDVCRAWSKFEENKRISTSPPPGEFELLSEEDKKLIEQAQPTFIDRYVQWAKTVGDAAEQYHVAGAFICLSSIMAASMQIPTSFGTIYPNLWFMLLADTTLTRKSTAMDLAMDVVNEIDDNILMATDGSLEGMMTALSARPKMPSVFLRDEFTGLVDQMHKKDYMAGMPEFLAKIYDGKIQKRLLRKEEIVVKEPRFIIFAGGIKSKMTRILKWEHVESGFIPRFVIVTAESDITRVKPLGPPVESSMEGRQKIIDELRELAQRYNNKIAVTNPQGKVIGVDYNVFDVTLTDDAWARFNQLDQTMTQMGLDVPEMADVYVPTYARLGISMLKCAMLIAASRTLEGDIEVTEIDLIKAASYGDQWRRYAQDVLAGIGKGDSEHKIDIILRAIEKKKTMARSRLMQTYHITAREMDEIARTLIARGLVTQGGEGRGTSFTILED